VTPFESICEKCEELIQPYLDRELDEAERLEAETHLSACEYCGKRYRFEASLRRYVRKACCSEEMSPELKAKLSALRTPLDA
jgi:anti-sigma factor (TIGR02949 family)